MKYYFSSVVDIFKYPRHQLIKGSLSNDDGEVKENGKKVVGLAFFGKTTTLHVQHTFLYISLNHCRRVRRENA